MKKLGMIVALGVLLSGCELSHQRYSALVDRCKSIGGEPVVYKTSEGIAYNVRCKIDGVVFRRGDY